MKTLVHVALAATLVAVPLQSQDEGPTWPQWRGPDRDGVSKETGWSLDGQELWRTNVGLGYSAVSIDGGRLFTLGHDPDARKDTVLCLDALTGERLWTHSFPAKRWSKQHGGGTLTTPAVRGERVFVANREGRMLCLGAADGEVLWATDLARTYDLKPPEWGWAASPLVVEERVVMNVGRVLTFDPDGELLWKSTRNYGDCYSTPVDLTFEGRELLAVFTSTGLVILDLATGSEVALHPWGKKPAMDNVNAPTPVVIGTRIFISSGYDRGCAMLEFTGDALTELWASRAMINEEAGCVHFGNHLYGFDRSSFECMDLDGNTKWSTRAFGKGAFVVANDKLVALSRRGDLVIGDAAPVEFRERSRARVLADGVNWTSPTVCGGLIYCRNSRGDLVCRDHRARRIP